MNPQADPRQAKAAQPSPAQRARRNHQLRERGLTWEQIAAVWETDHGIGPRIALRWAHNLSHYRVSELWNDLDPGESTMIKARIYQYERWPAHPNGRRPTLSGLDMLARIYQTTARRLLTSEEYTLYDPLTRARIDRIDYRHLDPNQGPADPKDEDRSARADKTMIRGGTHSEGGTLAKLNYLDSGSATRTELLLRTIQPRSRSRLRYLPPAGARDRVLEFLRSAARVFVIKGPPGCGKTSLTHHLVHDFANDVAFQMHAVDSWDIKHLDLATEILRYASIPRGDDSLLTLEQATVGLPRICLVTIDGVKTQQEVVEIGRQLDTVLRQVTTSRLRFLLVARTPPEIEVSTHPILAASVYESPGSDRGASYRLLPWTSDEARKAWDSSRDSGDPVFAELPPALKRLARVPVYMNLLKAAGRGLSQQEVNPYLLVDFCVRTILQASGQDVDRTIAELAENAFRKASDLIPQTLSDNTNHGFEADSIRYILTSSISSRHSSITKIEAPEFDHDVIHEYFVATRLAELVIERGRFVAVVGAFNELAERTTESATARGVFEFIVHHLDSTAPDVLMTVALSPIINLSVTLPLMLNTAASGSRFATADVLRTCARRCTDDSTLELARSLLTSADTARALGDGHASWLIGLIRRFGSVIWHDITSSLEQRIDLEAAHRLLAATNLDRPDEATFIARYFFLFFNEDHRAARSLEALLGHPDWRVRAAIAEGVRDQHLLSHDLRERVIGRLVADADYKVRAAVAKAITMAAYAGADRHLAQLLRDENWHVRACALQGVMPDRPDSVPHVLSTTTISTLTSDDSWDSCPEHVRPLKERLLLLAGSPGSGHEPRSRDQALFLMLREAGSGWLRLESATRETLVAEAKKSGSWLVRREVEDFVEPEKRRRWFDHQHRSSSLRELYRRLRDRRSIQVALDLHDLDRALLVAEAAVAAGADFIEVGDPLIKRAGLEAIASIKNHLPHTPVVAEMMSADWGRDQVEQAAQAGADVILLIGPATVASVSAAVDAGRRLDMPIVLDLPAAYASKRWVRDMERAGVDGFAVTTNIDLGVAGSHPLATTRAIRMWTRLPVAVSGGFSPSDHTTILDGDWDVLIVGRSIAEAVRPDLAARQFTELIHGRQKGGGR